MNITKYKEVNWYKVLYNLLVLKETESAFTFYNLWILNWDYWCYLEHYIVKEKFDLEKILQAIENEIEFWSELWIEFKQKALEQERKFDSYNRPADENLKKMIEIAKRSIFILEDDISLDLDLLDEIPEQINAFSREELFENKDKIDFSKINLNDPNIDIYIRDAISDMMKMWEIENEVKEAKTVEQKKSLSQKIKDWVKASWKIWLLWALFCSTLLSSWSSLKVEAHSVQDSNNFYSQEHSTINDFQFIFNQNNKDILKWNKILWIKHWDIIVWEWMKKNYLDITWVDVDATFYLRVNEWDNILFKWNSIFTWSWKQVVYTKIESWETIKFVLSNATWRSSWNIWDLAKDSQTLSSWDLNELPSAWDLWVWVVALWLLWLMWAWIAWWLKSLWRK